MKRSRIGRNEDIGAALPRLFGASLEAAATALASGRPASERVHRARQNLKRARSLLRVLAPALGPGAAAVRGELADAARLLAGARDADAAAASARGIRKKAADADLAGFADVVAALDRKAEEAHAGAIPVARIEGRLRAAGAAAAEAAAAGLAGAALFDRAVRTAYRKGRAAMRRARSSLATPDLHAWRKEVKSLAHLLSCGRDRLPGKAARVAERLDRLGDLLGLDHDHAMLAERLALSPDGSPSLMRQLSIIAAERKRLEAEARALGARVYRRRPRRFAARFAVR